MENFKFKCCIGKNGVKKHKIEGDNSTPKGIFTLGNLYYRKDRVQKPKTNLKIKIIKPNRGESHKAVILGITNAEQAIARKISDYNSQKYLLKNLS